ncbi:hypothetical protein [Niabella hibiscisoli]|uniref:hypothetical protein n=1 Tax=Niabella hibiscisoli TaxID=1825928 RepID=UPI001F111F31|nr:hypothetical protein [Niabella hibiscisoli]MCH5715944.1 hypothetical protein [Niabella hibiscisoli]
MRKLLYLFIAALSLLGCNKNSDPDLIFGSLPEERVAERNAELKSKLLESAGGWKAFLRTSLRGGGMAFTCSLMGRMALKCYLIFLMQRLLLLKHLPTVLNT